MTDSTGPSNTTTPTLDPFVPCPATSLRQRMIEDSRAQSQPGHATRPHSELQALCSLAEAVDRHGDCRRGSAVPAAPDRERSIDLQSQSHHAGVRFLFRMTLRRHNLAAEVWHLKEPLKLPSVLAPEEGRRILTYAVGLLRPVFMTH